MKGTIAAILGVVLVLVGTSADGRGRSSARRVVNVDRTRLTRLDPAVMGLTLKPNVEELTGRITLSDGTNTLILCPGMTTVLLNGEPVRSMSAITAEDALLMASPDMIAAIADALIQARSGGLHKIVIDAGHGGKDPGAMGKGGLKEKNVVLAVARRLAEILRARGRKVILTRNSDVFLTLDQRVRICNREMPDLFLSIHANASTVRSVHGIEAYFVRESLDDCKRARNAVGRPQTVEGVRIGSDDRYMGLALIQTMFGMSRRKSVKVAAGLQSSLKTRLSVPDRGIKGAGFRVLKGAKCPALLLEIGFISNPDTEWKFGRAEYLDRIASAISVGL